MRYKIIVEYDGAGFCGWQRQENAFSVQEALEEAVFKLSSEKTHVYGSGRTDTGVHATSQVAHFDLLKSYAPDRIVGALNFYLKDYKVAVLSCEIVDEEFHARFSAKFRSYIYKIVNRPEKVILDINRAWWVRVPLDVEAMQLAANYLIGKHDFSSFRATGCTANSPVRTISEISITNSGANIEIYVKAPSFLYHMVRNIVGSLVMVGKGTWSPEYLLEILEMKNRAKAGPTAPAHGLYFNSTEYSLSR